MIGSRGLKTCIYTALQLVLIALATPMAAQSTNGQELENVEPGSTVGIEAAPTGDESEGSQIYIGAVHGDWDVRCIASDGEPDPCQLYQLLEDEAGNPIAEINVFPVFGDNEVVAGATIVTPLETLLTEGLELSVDGGEITSHPFHWCSRVGCVSRISLSEDDLAAFRRGLQAKLSIVPAAAANRKVNLTVSLTGFIAAFSDTLHRSQY